MADILEGAASNQMKFSQTIVGAELLRSITITNKSNFIKIAREIASNQSSHLGLGICPNL